MHKKLFTLVVSLMMILMIGMSISAQEDTVKIGFVSTLSGPASALGIDCVGLVA